ncbi:MAG: DUF4340 domain-containing protein [Mariprofundaceae bacterium]
MIRVFRLLALAVILASVWVLWQGSRPERMPQVMDAWPSLAVEDVRGLHLDTGEDVLDLEMNNGAWFGRDEAGLHSANQWGVAMLLQLLADMRQMRVVTHNPRMHASLGVTSGPRVRLLDGAGRTLLDLYIGRGGVNLLSTYVRKADEDTVYAVDRLLAPLLKSSRAYWLPRAIGDE